jgi:vanillate O-demethylase ferredoxin subunit
MHTLVNEGDTVRISVPKNHFPLAHDAAHSILIAGGIGVTPLLCMAERLHHTGGSFAMHYCARSAQRMAFRQRIAAGSFHNRVHFHFDDGAEQQKFHPEVTLQHPKAQTHLYVCGPAGFMSWILDAAKAAGWPEAQVHREYFTAAPLDHSTDGGFDIRIASSGQTIRVAADQTVVAALAAHGIEVPMSCEQGVCGTCLTRVLAGEPDHKDFFLTPAEHALNDQFTPCCSRAKTPLLVLDL